MSIIKLRARRDVFAQLWPLYKRHRALGLSRNAALGCIWVVFKYGVIERPELTEE
jgi:hypothetical protein